MSAVKHILFILLFFSVSASAARKTVFVSKNAEYKVEVDIDFSFTSKPSLYKVKNKSGKIISEFKTVLSPIALIPLNNGKGIIGFYGAVGQTIFITQLRFYDIKGRLLKKHRLMAAGTGGQNVSANSEYFAYVWRDDGKSGILFFSTLSGELLWSKTFKKNLSGIKISGDGKWVVSILKNGKLNKKVVLFDSKGQLRWSGIVKTRDSCVVASVNKDGSLFEVNQSRLIYNENDGYSYNTVMKGIIYKNKVGKVKIIKTIVSPQKKSADNH